MNNKYKHSSEVFVAVSYYWVCRNIISMYQKMIHRWFTIQYKFSQSNEAQHTQLANSLLPDFGKWILASVM
jgi:hypothetical protein